MSSPLLTSDIRRNSLLGLAAIVLWSTTIAFSRSLTEQLGTLTAAALIYTIAGLIGLLYTAVRPGAFQKLLHLPRLYLLGCGALFVVYMAALYLAVGLAADRVQVLIVGLINYLWPALSLVFSIPILGQRARPFLPLGILLALAGIGLATTSGSPVSIQALLRGPSGGILPDVPPSGLLPYGFALAAAICWGLYSNLSRRWAAENDGSAVPLFLLASGLLLGILRAFTPEISHWSPASAAQLAYMSIFPGMLAYILWDIAVRKGEIILVESLSYLTPLLSTLFSTLILSVRPGFPVWIGAILVIIGAIICKASIVEARQLCKG